MHKPVAEQEPIHQAPQSSQNQPVAPASQDETTPLVIMPTQSRFSTVTIHYIDHHRVPLRPTMTLTGEVGTVLDLPWLKFAGYYLAAITNLKQHFPEENTTIWLFYKPQLAAPVMVLHQNLEGGLLIKPQFLSGALNERYQANPLEGGANFVHHISANQTGRFTTKTQFVHFKYDPLNLKHSDAPKQRFIELLESTNTYQQPSEEALTASRLPKHAVWKIYSRAITPSGKQWFNLGSFWISPTRYQLHATNPKGSDETYQVPKFTYRYAVVKTTSLNLSASLNNSTVTFWQAPYDHPTTYQVMPKTRVVIKQVVILDNQSRWCQLKTGQWLMEGLLTLN
ncbi:hypothetical protein FC90_GL001593 [Latilactobacillus graminis DSM 20719]|uniref:MucBP domain-containing protein n=1 Tax=Latilactobacillus graminis DSM 20719 TaxID=1423752 RepID=A0AA89KWE1_9LACO|nr:hypothetical protein FC90_GL001593 [Latilactobacillus graminis DSM 20719]